MSNLRVMTYNMLHAPGDRLQPLVEVVQGIQPDVLACQEINTFDGLMDLARELKMMPVWGPANTQEDYTGDVSKPYEHVALLTRYPVLEMRVHKGDVEAMFRSVLEVRVQVPNWQEITFFVVHFRALRHPEKRHLKIREAGAFVGMVAQARGPVVALGDFNAWAPGEGGFTAPIENLPEDHVFGLQGGVIGAIQASGLIDTYRHVNPSSDGPVSTLLHAENSRVDFIWASPDLKEHIAGSNIIDNPLVKLASDHRPVVTDFTW